MKRPQKRFSNGQCIDPENDSIAEVMQDLETLRGLLYGNDISAQGASGEVAEIINRLDKLTGIDFYAGAEFHQPENAVAWLEEDSDAAYSLS